MLYVSRCPDWRCVWSAKRCHLDVVSLRPSWRLRLCSLEATGMHCSLMRSVIHEIHIHIYICIYIRKSIYALFLHLPRRLILSFSILQLCTSVISVFIFRSNSSFVVHDHLYVLLVAGRRNMFLRKPVFRSQISEYEAVPSECCSFAVLQTGKHCPLLYT